LEPTGCFVYESVACVPPVRLRIAEQAERGLGFKVWRSAEVFARFLERRDVADTLRGARVLELGCGCGLVGVLAARLGAKVTLSDTADVVPLARLNLERNSEDGLEPGGHSAEPLFWGTDLRGSHPQGQFDVILGSDIAYFEALHGLLILTLLQLAARDTRVLLAHVRRGDPMERWRKRLCHFFSIELAATEEQLHSEMGVAQWPVQKPSEGSVNIFELRLLDCALGVDLPALLRVADAGGGSPVLKQIDLAAGDLSDAEE